MRRMLGPYSLGPALAALMLAASPAYAARDLLIGGGAVSGIYYQVALQVCAILNKHAGAKYNCVGRPALGSVFNINAVNRGLLDFGVCQSDRNWQASNGEADWSKKGAVKELRSVFSMHSETVMVVARKDANIESISDLKGKRVNIGNPGSGHRANAEDLLALYGLDKDKDITAKAMQQSDASRALVDKEIDAFFYTVGNPNTAVEEPAESTDIRIIPIDPAKLDEFIKSKPYYVRSTVPAGLYRGIHEPVETYGVKATVVTSSELEDDVVYDVVKTLFANLDELKESHAAFRDLNPKEMLTGLSAPLHPGAIKFYKEQGWL